MKGAVAAAAARRATRGARASGMRGIVGNRTISKQSQRETNPDVEIIKAMKNLIRRGMDKRTVIEWNYFHDPSKTADRINLYKRAQSEMIAAGENIPIKKEKAGYNNSGTHIGVSGVVNSSGVIGDPREQEKREQWENNREMGE